MKAVFVCIAALTLAACASTSGTSGSQASSKSVDEKEYRTGSRIPVRDPSTQGSSSVTSADPSALRPGTPKAN